MSEKVNWALIVNEACLDAADQCVGGFDVENEGEIVNGKVVDVKNLGKKGSLSKVIAYWSSEETIGGGILWDAGYYHELPEEVLDIFSRAEKVVNDALIKAFG